MGMEEEEMGMEKELGYGGGGGVRGWRRNLGNKEEEELGDGEVTWVYGGRGGVGDGEGKWVRRRRSWGWRSNMGMEEEEELGMER